MIYPESFPDNKKGHPEELVFNALKKVSDRYDIFYSRKFKAITKAEKPEYEIDFIVADPGRAILCLEAKGGVLSFNAINDTWKQDSKLLQGKDTPDEQARSNNYSFINRFSNLLKEIPVDWGLVFPQSTIINGSQMPSGILEDQVIDQSKLLFIEESLINSFEKLKAASPNRKGNKWDYEKLKGRMLRGLETVQLLGSRIAYDEEKLIRLTDEQINVVSGAFENQKLVVNGPAGSGKTIIAKTLAVEFANADNNVGLFCFNHTLSNKIRYDFDLKRNENVLVTHFHRFAKRIIEEHDNVWWNNSVKNGSDFWEFDVPEKLDELSSTLEITPFDVLIIDEGQDFKEFWFEALFKWVGKETRVYIFLDQFQDIFGKYTGIPVSETFSKYRLTKNCRNTKSIINYLNKIEGVSNIKPYEDSPEGDKVKEKSFKNRIELVKYLGDLVKDLTENSGINPEQILILLNSSKEESGISDVKQLAGFDIKSLDLNARFKKNQLHYSTINIFKGLEADIVIILDSNKVSENKLYTEASRAKHKVLILNSDGQ